MILDSIKKYMGKLYTSLKDCLSVSNILGLCLTVLFVGLSEVVKGQTPDHGQSTGNGNTITINLTQDFVNASSFTLDNQDLRRQLTENAASKEFYIFNVSQNNNGWLYLNSFGLSLYTSENTLFTNFTNL